MQRKPETCLDGYKIDHRRQYAPGTSLVMANVTARGSRVDWAKKIVLFGNSGFVKEYLLEFWDREFFNKPIEEILHRFTRRLNGYIGEAAAEQVGTEHLEYLHGLGYLPLRIMAIPEGEHLPMRIPSMVVYNTDPKCFWLTNAIETTWSNVTWIAPTTATTSNQYRVILDAWCNATNPEAIDFVPFQAHDFSFRGLAGLGMADMVGAAHLTSFVGTDTVPAIDYLEDNYMADCEKELVGTTVFATEHSVMCSGGKEDELLTFNRLITETYPNGILSIVSDTWDFWKVINPDGGLLAQLKDKIVARDGKVVIRPDSGDPVKIVTGWTAEELKSAGREVSEIEAKGLVQCLWEIFGGTTSSKDMKVLSEKIGAIYGDAITLERVEQICGRLATKGFASTNIVFGVGSFTYGGAINPDAIVTRDTYGFAVKATYIEKTDGTTLNIFKDPITDDGLKKSAKGITAVFKDENGEYHLKDEATWEEFNNCELVEIFNNGELKNRQSLQNIRERVIAGRTPQTRTITK